MTTLASATHRLLRPVRCRSTMDRDWRRSECATAAAALLGHVLTIERHLEHATDLLGDQPLSDDPAWTTVGHSSSVKLSEGVRPYTLGFLQEYMDEVTAAYPESERRAAVLLMLGSDAVTHFAEGLLDAVVDAWMLVDRGVARAEAEEALGWLHFQRDSFVTAVRGDLGLPAVAPPEHRCPIPDKENDHA